MEPRTFAIHNDFTVTPIQNGYVYDMTDENGSSKVTNIFFDRGFVLNCLDMRMPYISNQDKVGKMNYLMICCTIYGRKNLRIEGVTTSRTVGSAEVYRPSGRRVDMTIPTSRYIGLVIGIDVNKFRIEAPHQTDEILNRIAQNYKVDQRRSFLLDSITMVKLQMI